MDQLEQKIIDVIRAQFADAEIRYDHEPDERISGFIVSEKFLDMDHEARQGAVWKLLRSRLSSEERQQVLGFLIYTPEEVKAYTEVYQD
ncbi:MAG: hypothetical protein ACREOI_06745 [bacterium]